MMRRAVLLLAALFAVAAIAATPASAQAGQGSDDDYTSNCSPLTLSKTSVNPGDTITVSGTAAVGGETVFIGLDDSTLLGSTSAAPFTHEFSVTVTIPAGTKAGNHTISAFQDNAEGCDDQVSTVAVASTSVTPPAGEPLARTGSNSTMPLVRLGFGLLAAGGMAIFVSRRRKTAATASA
jgi:hypothetical protein